ncbi:hypothetical protein [Streptococcus pantholopis]|uniref:Uncharacterized protein n=1 Tax=Streptococcus pantholopis TaxID=1811193 RepID=A0A172Q8I8_9STRE|nr:hypothetical protein [Streptococcus pantholopis]AND79784.1 hypothetical protein A0O21_06965 [Streptococcus pantholopis]
MSIATMAELLAAFGIGTIVSAIFTFIQSSKRNRLDYITKERSKWRREIKLIAVNLSNRRNRLSAINRLKTLINSYGFRMNFKYSQEYYMKDGHIWDLLDSFDYSNDQVDKLVKYLELLLKYDWERSKKETQFQFLRYSYNVIRCLALLFLLATFFIYTSNINSNHYYFYICMFFDWYSIICLFAQDLVEGSWEIDSFISSKKQLMLLVFFYIIPYMYVIIKLIHFYTNKFSFYENFVFILFIVSILSAIYFFSKHFGKKQEYVAKLKNIDFENPKMTEQVNELYNEINHLQNQLYRFDYQVTKNELSKLKNKRDKLKVHLNEKQKEIQK